MPVTSKDEAADGRDQAIEPVGCASAQRRAEELRRGQVLDAIASPLVRLSQPRRPSRRMRRTSFVFQFSTRLRRGQEGGAIGLVHDDVRVRLELREQLGVRLRHSLRCRAPASLAAALICSRSAGSLWRRDLRHQERRRLPFVAGQADELVDLVQLRAAEYWRAGSPGRPRRPAAGRCIARRKRSVRSHAPSAWKMSTVIGSAGVRILRPFRSSGLLMGSLELLVCRIPLSHQSSDDHADACEFLGQFFADRPVEHLDGGLGVREQKGQAERSELRHQAGRGALTVRRQVERSRSQAGQHRHIVSELLGAGDLDGDVAAGALRDHFGEGFGREGAGVARRGAVPKCQRSQPRGPRAGKR